MGPATTGPNSGRTRAETRRLPPLVPSDGKIAVHIADHSIEVEVAYTVAVEDNPVGRIGADTAVGIAAAVVEKLVAVGVVDIAAASASGWAVDAIGVEPGIGVAVVAADTLGIAAVGGASAVVGTVQRRVEGPTR